jgi:hypothetical protein
MKSKTSETLRDGDQCDVVGGTHAGKSGTGEMYTPVKQVTLRSPLNKKMEFASRPWGKMWSLKKATRHEAILAKPGIGDIRRNFEHELIAAIVQVCEKALSEQQFIITNNTLKRLCSQRGLCKTILKPFSYQLLNIITKGLPYRQFHFLYKYTCFPDGGNTFNGHKVGFVNTYKFGRRQFRFNSF